jgi:serine phosphatase RsbU (regulator of sigma subunit)
MASAEKWLIRQDSVTAMIREGCGLAFLDSDRVMSESYTNHAYLAAFLNRPKDFNRAVAAYRTTQEAKSSRGKENLASLLLEGEHYAEAADEYAVLDQFFAEHGLGPSLVNIGRYGDKFRANYKAGRRDTALAVAAYVFEHLDSAITEQKNSDAAELATVYETQKKDAEIAQQQISLTRQRWLGTLVALILLTTFFIVYTLYRRRAQKRLAAAHEKLEVAHAELKSAYDQLEETTAAKERIESELQVARNIQMSMIPHKFPERPEIDIYASMIPAKEVGGDLYDFFLKDDTLYFCIGDVSGKGVPASLLMTVTTSQFRTVSRYLDQPEQIMMAINNQIAEGNDALMFVTMIIGCLDLKTGHLAYSCGAHNPPLLIGSSVEKLPVSHKPPVGVMKGMKYVFQETQISPGTTLFLYTDGLTEAMNAELKMFGNDRMVETAQRLISDGVSTSKSLISGMSDAVEAFVTGADQSDDLTMMAIRFNG